MDSWPLTLPQVPGKRYQLTPVSGLVSDEDTLSPKRNRTYPEIEVSCLLNQLTIQQVQELRTFYNVTLNQTKPFIAPWLKNVGFDNHFFQFRAAPKMSSKGLKFDVAMQLIIIAGVPMSGGQIMYGVL